MLISQPSKKRATTYRIQIVYLLKHYGRKKLIFKNVCLCKSVVCSVTDRIMCFKC